MKKKLLSLLLVAAMGVTMLVGCGGSGNEGTEGGDSQNAGTNGGAKTIKVWVAENVVDFTNEQIAAWKAANADMADWEVTVEAVGEGQAAGNMITDVSGGADIYGFAQDQLARLVAAEAISPIGGTYADTIKANNDAGSVGAVTVDDKVYAFPLTSDNGFFMYYDKSVITDPSSLDAILEACEAAGKSFYFTINDAWYNSAFFFATGCVADYTTATVDGATVFSSVELTYASAEGVAATKAMIDLYKSPAFVNGSSVSTAANAAAVVSGTWDKEAAVALWGDNMGCAKLPTATIDGKQVQLSGMGGFKLLGVKPQTDAAKQQACLSLADWLSNEATQLARFNAVGWGPSNVNAQANDAVKSDAALAALAEQMAYTLPQGQYPDGFWTDITAFGDSIMAGEFDGLTDDQILEKLQALQTTLESYVTAE